MWGVSDVDIGKGKTVGKLILDHEKGDVDCSDIEASADTSSFFVDYVNVNECIIELPIFC